MLEPISNNVYNLWEQWNIRGSILFSLFLQIFLTLCSPLRKCVQNDLLRFSIWAACLAADWTANFCVGNIASNQVSDNKTSSRAHKHLLAFWAPFLLVHLGGPDTITAFSLEDNKLWKRHLLGFVIQFITCAYVFLLTIPGNKLWIPIVLVFVAGMIKCGERILALAIANIPKPEIELAGIPIEFPDDLEIRSIEVGLNQYYDVFFTKFLALFLCCICRLVAISCVLTALGLFFNEDKHKQGFNDFDVRVTYTLLCGAVAMDIIGLLMFLFSAPITQILDGRPNFIYLKKFLDYLMATKRTKCKKKPFTNFTELSTWLPFRRWNESIPSFNVISYCHSMVTKYRCMKSVVPSHFKGSTIIFMLLHVVKNPFLYELWEFIYNEVRKKCATERGPFLFFSKSEEDQRIDLILGESLINEEQREKLKSLVDEEKNGYGCTFYSIIIAWHIATCILYVVEKDEEDQIDERDREFSKVLSDYMLYLLIEQSDMILSTSPYKKQFRKTILQVMLFFNKDENETEACGNLLARGGGSDSIDFACKVAKELGKIPQTSIKWKIISQVWVEILSRAAYKCSAAIHFKHLCEGGEFISLVWQLIDRGVQFNLLFRLPHTD